MLKIICRDVEVNYENDGKTILQTLEDNGLKAFSMCKEGYCHTCCMKIKSGDVEYIVEPLGYVADDEILPCVCKPKTNIVIDYN